MKRNHKKSDLGASLVEYGLLIALLSVICIAAVRTVGASVDSSFKSADRLINGIDIGNPEEI